MSRICLLVAVMFGALSCLAPAASAQANHPAIIRSENGWNVIRTAEGCHAIVPDGGIYLSGAQDPNVRVSWTGACQNGLVNGSGSLVNTYTIPASEWGPAFSARNDFRGTAVNGMFDGVADEANYSSMDYGTQYASTDTWDGFTPPAGLSWHDGGDVRNPMPHYFREGCSYFVDGYKGDPSYKVSAQPDYDCQASDGAALRDSVRAGLAGASAPVAPPVATGPASSGSGGQASTGGGGAPDPSKSKKVHNPAMDRTACVKLEQRANPNAQFGVVGSQVLINNCGETVEVFWCNVATECSRGFGNTWTLKGDGPSSSWPIDEGEFRYAACKGPNSGGFDKGSEGQTFTCPEWPE